ILDVDLPRPRNRLELAEDGHYNHIRQQVLRFLYEKQRNPAMREQVLTPVASVLAEDCHQGKDKAA
ncbi:MAG: ABC transporter ATP-binding protein, partial [Porticoccaceae bacterium]